MFIQRRIARSIALACATVAVAAAPSAAFARPAGDPPGHPGSNGSRGAVAAEPQTIVREVQTGGDQTIALILSGSALLVAIAGAGFTGQSRRRTGRLAQPQA
jgi:LPXTG-motif cell wall-anchored protein